MSAIFFAPPAFASHDSNTTDADCPSTWAPQYGVTCGDSSKPKACGVLGGVPQCIAIAALPTGVCNGGSVRVNCDACTASCACSVGGNIVCSGGSPATFGTCQAPQSCAIAGRVTANSCTGACGGCASGFEDLTPATTTDPCVPIRPKVTLAPPEGFPDADTTTNSSLYINKTGGTGNLARFQRGGTDRVIVTNSGQLVLGLASDFTTFTQTLGAGENLIYGAIHNDSSAQGNVLLFERQWPEGGPPLLRLDTFGNLTVNGNVTVGGTLTVTGTVNGVDMANVLTGLTVGSAGGLNITGTGHSRTLSLLTTCANGEALFWNSITSAWKCGTAGLTQEGDPVHTTWLGTPSLSTLTVSGALTAGSISATTVNATGCFGAVFDHATTNSYDGNRGGYSTANQLCGAGQHVCTGTELLNSINCGIALPTTDTAWASVGLPGFTSPAVNDCTGWQTNSGTKYGAYWDFSTRAGFSTSCDQPLPFACCR